MCNYPILGGRHYLEHQLLSKVNCGWRRCDHLFLQTSKLYFWNSGIIICVSKVILIGSEVEIGLYLHYEGFFLIASD